MTAPRHLGIAAVSAEGAALCYRTFCVEGAAVLGPHDHPPVTMHTHPLARHVKLIAAGRWEEVGNLLLRSASTLAAAGAEFVVCPDNTAHQGLDLVRDRSPLPWLHIAEEVAAVATARGFRRIGLLGTRYLMEGPVYPAKLAPNGIEWRTPDAPDRERLNRIILDDLVYGRFENEARRWLQGVIRSLGEAGCDAVVLGCTEIPLLVSEAESPLPAIDSTRTLARAALREATRPAGAAPSPRQVLGLVALVVRDYDEAIAFFCGTLGFSVVEDRPVPEQQKRWVVVRPPGSTGADVLLARAASPEQETRIGDQTGGRVFLFLRTDDFRRDYDAYRAKGVEFVRPPREESYGTVSVFRDLYGNLWDLVGPATG